MKLVDGQWQSSIPDEIASRGSENRDGRPPAEREPAARLDGSAVEPAEPGKICRFEVPLGNNADFASLGEKSTTYESGHFVTPPSPVDIHSILPPPSTVKAWWLRSYGREILSKSGVQVRMRWCGSRISRGKDGVGIYARPDRAYGRVHGVCVCGQSLACPVCAPRIAVFRAAEVSECFVKVTAVGQEARLETFTMPHCAGTSLAVEIEAFSRAWRKFQGGRSGGEVRSRSFGSHTAREVTWGVASGWHYHHHRCRYDEPGSYDAERVKYYWLAALEAVGRRTAAAEDYAFHCGAVGDKVGAAYVGKLATAVEAQARAIGSEVSSAATKGRNLATLLLAASCGDVGAGKVWREGVQCITQTKVSSVRWSSGLRAKVGMVKEKSDETVAKEEVLKTDVFLGALNPMQWSGVLLWKAEFALCIAANQGRAAVNSFLAGLNLGQLDDEPRPRVVIPLKDETCYKGWKPLEKTYKQNELGL